MNSPHPNTRLRRYCLALLLFAGTVGCSGSKPAPAVNEIDAEVASGLAARLLPSADRRLLIVGQDLDAIAGYVGTDDFPTPGGVTTYLAFYSLLSRAYPQYGALGEDAGGTPIGYDVDWGAGRLNANTAALLYRQSALAIGLNFAEGSGDAVWAAGGLAAIARGEHDDKIDRLARFLKTIDKPVYLRIGYEFDGAWNRGYADREAYIRAYRRIADGLRAGGAERVAFVWQASASPVDDVIDGGHEDIVDWYPGDDYVDWLGLSWFLHADEGPGGGVTQRQLADEVVALARKRNKPVMIAEAAPQGYDLARLTRAHSSPLRDGVAAGSERPLSAEAIWEAWFEPLFDYMDAHRDVVRALAYINADWDSQSMWSAPYQSGYWGDSRLQVNPVIRERWRQRTDQQNGWLHGGADLDQSLQN